jgi:aspartate racemase
VTPPESSSQRAETIVGLVGGLGPESTIDYYRRILAAWEIRSPRTAPSMIIDSLDVWRAIHLATNDRAGMAEYVLASLQRLARAGAHFGAITANTPHLVFDELAAQSTIPLISIVETCADEAERRGLRRLALLGSRFTMEGSFYTDVFARRGLEIIVPDKADRDLVHDRYVNQLLAGDFRDETRAEFMALVQRLHRDQAIDAVILGGTELPLLLRSPTVADVPALDTTAIHVDAIVRRLRSK